MNRETSLYLDFVRFCAALVVFLSHAAGQRFTQGFLWQIGPYGGEAVMVFFVLSGFVIGYVTDRNETSVAAYGVSRAARLLSVAVPALVLTAILDGIGRSLHPGYYNAAWGYDAAGLPMQFLRALTFTNAVWGTMAGPGSDLPFWSLGYEAAYYVIFAIAIFAPWRWRLPGVAAALVLAGPDIAALFPVWLLGVGCHRVCSRVAVGTAWGVALMLGPVLAWAGYEAAVWRMGLARQDWVVGPLFAAHLAGVHAVAPAFGRGLDLVARPVRWLAGATFSIYLFHLPVLQFLTTVTPWQPGAWQNRLLMLPGALAACIALSTVSERRKGWWRTGIEVLLRRCGLRRAGPLPARP